MRFKSVFFSCAILFITHAHAVHDFVFVNDQKTGTYLFFKTIHFLCEKKSIQAPWINESPVNNIPSSYNQSQFSSYIQKYLSDNRFIHVHFQRPNFDIIEEYLKDFDLKRIMIVRDIRDVACSSLQFHVIEGEYKNPDAIVKLEKMSIDDKLTFVITDLLNLNNKREKELRWFKDPEVLKIRFEDLVGTFGGGNDKAQRNTIKEIAKYLDIPLTREKLDYVCKNIYGNENNSFHSGTYRKGKIGQWKQQFSQEHKMIFKNLYGKYLIQLGYEKDSNW